MLEIGAMVVYGKTGVCTVEGQCEKELVRNQKRLYYILKPFGSPNSTIFVPAEDNKVFVRPIMSKKEADSLIEKIPEIIESSANIELSKEQYDLMIATHNCEDLVGLASRLYQKKKLALENRKKPGYVDERYMALAEKLLLEELACALEMTCDQVKEYIGKKLNIM